MTPQQLVTPSSDARLTLLAFGEPRLVAGDGTLLLTVGKPLALVTYLALTPGRSASRAFLTDLLWRDFGQERGRHALRQTVWQLRQTLGGNSITGGEDVSLSLVLDGDVNKFSHAINREDLESAISAYSASFFLHRPMTGARGFEFWVDVKRQGFRSQFSAASRSLARRRLQQGKAREAHALARRLREADPEDEHGWALLVETSLAIGNEVLARSEADQLSAYFQKEGVGPSPAIEEVLRLAKQTAGTAVKEAPPESELVAELVGREVEYSAIVTAWRQTRCGTFRHFHLLAPAGLGKSRLLADVSANLRIQGARTVHVRAQPGERYLEYALAGEVARVLGKLPGATGVSPGAAAALVALHPSLSGRMSPPPDPATGSEALRRRTAALHELILAVADEKGFTLFVDDLHWADEASFRLLDGAFGRLDRIPVLIITTGRPVPARVPHSGSVEVLTLHPFSEGHTHEFLTSLGAVPTHDHRTQGALARLHRASEGSPFLLLEIVRLALQRCFLGLEGGVWCCPDPLGLGALLDDGQVTRARLEALSAPALRLLQISSLAGYPVGSGLLMATEGTEDRRLEVELTQLEIAGLVTSTLRGYEPFHDEIGIAALGMLSPEESRQLHRRLGRAQLALAGAEPANILLAGRHLIAGEDNGEAATAFQRFIAASRQRGDRRAHRQLAIAFNGNEDPAAARALVRGLPLRQRIGLHSSNRAWAAVAVIASLIMGSGLALSGEGVALPVENAELMLIEPDPGDSTVTFRSVPVALGDWEFGLPLQPNGSVLRVRDQLASRSLVQGVYRDPSGIRWYGTGWADNDLTSELFQGSSLGSHWALSSSRDDGDGRISPDGRQLAFATARWMVPRPGHYDYDLALWTVGTDSVVRFAATDEMEQFPVWSPDGTRIAFLRRDYRTGRAQICVQVVWAQIPACRRLEDHRGKLVPVGWSGPGTVLVLAESGDRGVLLELGVDDGRLGVAHPGPVQSASASDDGRWVACICGKTVGGPVDLLVWPTGNAAAARRVARAQPGGTFAWVGSRGPGYVQRVSALVDTLLVPIDASAAVAVVAYDAYDEPLDLPPAAWKFVPADTVVVVVDNSGRVVPRDIGITEILVEAAGRRQTLPVRVTRATATTVVHETWGGLDSSVWIPFGAPRPVMVQGPDKIRGLNPNGDGSFPSGVYSAFHVTPTLGAGVEVQVSTAITSTLWQSVVVTLQSVRSQDYDGWDHATGGRAPTRWGNEECLAKYPASETELGLHSLMVGGDGRRASNCPCPHHLARGSGFGSAYSSSRITAVASPSTVRWCGDQAVGSR